jgi:hypothetical protein
MMTPTDYKIAVLQILTDSESIPASERVRELRAKFDKKLPPEYSLECNIFQLIAEHKITVPLGIKSTCPINEGSLDVFELRPRIDKILENYTTTVNLQDT